MFDWILSVIEDGGYFGIFFLMVIENIFPPLPSEVILPLAGFAAARGDLNVIIVVVVAAAGAVTGCLPWYVLGRVFSIARLKHLSARYGRLVTLSPDDIDTAKEWFICHGQSVVLFGRLLPTIRTLISIPAGMARMPLGSFLSYSYIGSMIWTIALVLVGYALESQYEKVSQYVNLASDGIVFFIVGIYLYRVVTFRAKDTHGQFGKSV
ncbi:DedA family protein [Candidatus Kaiserbacteria bacterium]|nr:DedA family protein [Candidatus Kaiserbacteria bacterium]